MVKITLLFEKYKIHAKLFLLCAQSGILLIVVYSLPVI